MTRVVRISMMVALSAVMVSCGKGSGLSTGDFVLRVQIAGGLFPVEADQVSVPEFALTADGRVVTGGPQIEIYPGPAMPNVQQRTITSAGVDAIEAEARAAGLLGPDAHYDNDLIIDAATIYFTVVADGTRHVVSAYALGDAEDSPGTSASDRDARAKLQRFREKLGDLGSWVPEGSLGEEKPYEITALRVAVGPAGDNPDDGVKPSEIDWPLAGSLATFGEPATRCGIVSGDDLTKVLPRAQDATQITIWRSDGKRYNLRFRPQLPDEQGCEVPTRSE